MDTTSLASEGKNVTPPPQESVIALTPEMLDQMYPAPPWATRVWSSYREPDCAGWGRDGEDFIRNLSWEGEYCSIDVSETYTPVGYMVEAPVFTGPGHRLMDCEQASHGAAVVIGKLTADVAEAARILPEAIAYVNAMTSLH